MSALTLPVNIVAMKPAILEHANIPDEFLCPISFRIMMDPVITREGINFDRKAILAWLQNGSDQCPITGKPLSPRGLFPNYNLMINIEAWCDKTRISFENEACSKVKFLGIFSKSQFEEEQPESPAEKQDIVVETTVPAVESTNPSSNSTSADNTIELPVKVAQMKVLPKTSGSAVSRRRKNFFLALPPLAETTTTMD